MPRGVSLKYSLHIKKKEKKRGGRKEGDEGRRKGGKKKRKIGYCDVIDIFISFIVMIISRCIYQNI